MAEYATSILHTKMDTLISERNISQKRIDEAQKLIDRETDTLKEINRKIKELEKAVTSLQRKKEPAGDKT